MKLLIDGDSILYRVAFRGEELGDESVIVDDVCDDDGMGGLEEIAPEYAFSGDHKIHLPSSFEAVEYSIESMAHAVILDFIADDDITIDGIEIHMTGKPGREHCEGLKHNFRIDYVDDYKADRKESRPPAGLKELWSHIFSITEIDGLPVEVYVADGAEADDTVVFQKKMHPDKYVVCALDKDVLYQSVGRHYNYGKQEFVTVTAEEAQKYLFFQMINGDPSDGYKGVPGVGKVGANKALANLTTDKEMWDVTLALFKKKGLGLGEALQTGILASMHQVTSVRYEGNRIIPEVAIFKAIK